MIFPPVFSKMCMYIYIWTHPAILSLRTRSIRRFYTVVSNMLPGFLRVCLPVLFFLLLSASYAALSFGRAKSDFEDPTAAGYAIW